MSAQPFEKLATFYLGKDYDVDAGAITDDLVLYDAKDLTTHAVCVGMTGSGKTGLCLGLLEEAAIDRVPAIAIDPKGDLGNLLLTFPRLHADDFRPWVEPEAAARKGLTVDEFAVETAATWKQGLAGWGQDGARIARFRDAVDLTIYTPGSDAGVPVKVLQSFSAPPPALRDDRDAMRERVMAAASGLLALLGVDADPVRSREHILLSTLLDHAWRAGRDLELGTLIREIQEPPIDRIGVMDIESFYPAKERFELSLQLNNLLASPGFAVWMEGEPMDVGRLLHTDQGKPRLSIVSIAHLSDAERMFFVTMLLNEIVAWMRTQPGSSSLRALLYMDEVFGFLPPTANPPSKTPMLTLLKQARAFGLGVVLATQNPVDLDYKALSNAGTWFLGRLQTERDKARVLDGLEGASSTAGGQFDRGRTEAILSGLKSRVFYMNNVHDDRPTVFHTRWALSYLRGPLTRTQIRSLMKERVAAVRAASVPEAVAVEKTTEKEAERPLLPPGVPESFLMRQGALPRGA
ncbi:MAG: ATP-binding protein, partial [Planctomycetota bacterium]